VLLGQHDADKVELVLVMKVNTKMLYQYTSERPHAAVLRRRVLHEDGEHFWFPKENIVKVFGLSNDAEGAAWDTEKMRAQFRVADADGNGELTQTEVKSLLTAQGLCCEDAYGAYVVILVLVEPRPIIRSAEPACLGPLYVCFEPVLAADDRLYEKPTRVYKVVCHTSSETNVARMHAVKGVFDTYDADQSGTIGESEFVQVSRLIARRLENGGGNIVEQPPALVAAPVQPRALPAADTDTVKRLRELIAKLQEENKQLKVENLLLVGKVEALESHDHIIAMRAESERVQQLYEAQQSELGTLRRRLDAAQKASRLQRP